MQFSTTLVLLLASGLNTLAAPMGGLNPKGPWQISQFKSFDAAPGPNGISSISFNFYDPSTKVRTKCQNTLSPGSGRAPINDVYFPCDNSQVSYIYDGKSLGIQFSFHDPSYVFNLSNSFIYQVKSHND